MTRFARGGPANKKKPKDASSWQELKKTSAQTSSAASTTGPSEYGTNRARTSSNSKSANSLHKDAVVHKTNSKSVIMKKKKMAKGKFHSANLSSKISDDHDDFRRPKNKNKLLKKAKEKLAANKIDSDIHDLDTSRGYSQNSRSLIEELEDLDRKQMAEISKQEKTQQKEPTGSSEERKKQLNKNMDKKERRREERRLKRQKTKTNKMVCYHCREPGHGVADCPRALADAEQGTGVCYRCGSTEHDSSQCTARIDPNEGEFPFAKCFICQEMGHLSRSCPDNPKGLYPMGGCCQFCESVEHMSWNCPHNKKVKGVKDVHVASFSNTSHLSADAEMFEEPRRVAPVKKKQPKVVKF